MINNWPSFSFNIYINMAFNCAVCRKSFATQLLSSNLSPNFWIPLCPTNHLVIYGDTVDTFLSSD